MDIKVKICGMKEPANILEVVGLQPDYLGFIFYKPSKRYIDGLLPSFVKDLPAGMYIVSVLYKDGNVETHKVIVNR